MKRLTKLPSFTNLLFIITTQEAVVNMQRAFELFHEERSAEVNALNEQFMKQKKESELALNVCEKALNEARESEKAAMNALNVVTERERVMAIELKSLQEEVMNDYSIRLEMLWNHHHHSLSLLTDIYHSLIIKGRIESRCIVQCCIFIIQCR